MHIKFFCNSDTDEILIPLACQFIGNTAIIGELRISLNDRQFGWREERSEVLASPGVSFKEHFICIFQILIMRSIRIVVQYKCSQVQFGDDLSARESLPLSFGLP